MDTKSKKLGNRTGAKVLAFFLCIVFLTTALFIGLTGVMKLAKINDENNFYYPGDVILDTFNGTEYIDSDAFYYHNQVLAGTLVSVFEDTKSIESVDGEVSNTIYAEFEQQMYNIYSEMQYQIESINVYSSDVSSTQFGEFYYTLNDGTELVFDLNKVANSDVMVQNAGNTIVPNAEEESSEEYAGETQYQAQYLEPVAEGEEFDTIIDGTKYIVVTVTEEFDIPSEEYDFVEYIVLNDFDSPGVKEAFTAMFLNQVEQIHESVKNSYVHRSDVAKELLEQVDADYFIGNGSIAVSNVELGANKYPKDMSIFEDAKVLLSYNNGITGARPENALRGGDFFEGHKSDVMQGTTAYMSFSDAAFAEREAIFNSISDILYRYFITAIIFFILALILFIWLIVVTGRKREDGTRKLYALDKIFIEIKLAIIAILIAFGYLGLYEVSFRWDYFLRNDFTNLVISIPCAILFVGGLIILWCILSIVRDIKAGLFIKHSLLWFLICRPLKALFLMAKSGLDGTKPFAKTILLVIAYVILTLIGAGMWIANWYYNPVPGFIFIVVVSALALYFAYTRIKKYERLKDGISAISQGNLKHVINVRDDENSEFDDLSRKVNSIGAAIDIAVENELKNQRLKTDLISNVSHDLKTPLTSIITYTDLLKNEGLDCPDALKYLDIIDDKSKRLKKLTEDLFDAAKASSGAMNVYKEKVDILALLNQEIVEMNGIFEEANLDLIIDANESNYYVLADSQLLWRVVDNLLTNVRKYAMPGSRVYINLDTTDDGMTVMEIKNVSKDKLNIPVDELMERFKRGDEARSSEGSGLGLAIAKDLVRLQGGTFELDIDGDLFKSVTTMNTYQHTESSNL